MKKKLKMIRVIITKYPTYTVTVKFKEVFVNKKIIFKLLLQGLPVVGGAVLDDDGPKTFELATNVKKNSPKIKTL